MYGGGRVFWVCSASSHWSWRLRGRGRGRGLPQVPGLRRWAAAAELPDREAVLQELLVLNRRLEEAVRPWPRWRPAWLRWRPRRRRPWRTWTGSRRSCRAPAAVRPPPAVLPGAGQPWPLGAALQRRVAGRLPLATGRLEADHGPRCPAGPRAERDPESGGGPGRAAGRGPGRGRPAARRTAGGGWRSWRRPSRSARPSWWAWAMSGTRWKRPWRRWRRTGGERPAGAGCPRAGAAGDRPRGVRAR